MTRLLPGARAEIEIRRQSACGETCGNCTLCKAELITAVALDKIGAKAGDLVTVESRSVLGLAALTYIAPIAVFFVGYALGGAGWGGAAFAASVLALIPLSRRVKTVFTITAIDKRMQL